MSIERIATHRLLTVDDIPPTQDDLRVVGVFNPGAIEVDGQVVLLARIAEAPRDVSPTCRCSPRWDDGRIVIDHFKGDFIDEDQRVFRVDRGAHARLTFISHLRAIRLDDGGTSVSRAAIDRSVRFDPAGPWEHFGVEDPRITKIDDRYWITYVAVSRVGPCTALAGTSDFRTFQRHGIIFPIDNKDVTLFPRRVGGRYLAMHRPMGHFSRPTMWLADSPDLLHWGNHRPLPIGEFDPATGKVGGGCPPIHTDRGWLVIFHGNDQDPDAPPNAVGSYYGEAMLLDHDDPTKIIARAREPFFRPEAEFERRGFVNNVVFPTGIVDRRDQLLIYYGAADDTTAVAVWSKQDILDSLR